jgi:hypothetical protein
MISTLQEVLDLVGTLDDTTGENPSRERFRNYLARSAQTIGAVRACHKRGMPWGWPPPSRPALRRGRRVTRAVPTG